MGRRFADRRDAGRALARAVEDGATLPDPVELGLPEQPELAMGAIAAAGGAVETVHTVVAARAGVDDATFALVRARELAELHRREGVYRSGREPVELTGRDVVLVDDGLATGATMRAAVAAVRGQHPASVTVAVPVGSPRACAELAPQVDRLVCPEAPAGFRAVGQAYRNFSATEDAEVVAALDTARSTDRRS